MRSKYGNTDVKIPEAYFQEKAAVAHALQIGEIDEADARRRTLKIQQQANLFIVMTNGGYTVPTKGKKKARKKLERVQRYLEEKMKQLEANEEETEDTPVTTKPSPEPIDTPSRTPGKPVDPEKEEGSLMDHLQPMIDAALAGEPVE